MAKTLQLRLTEREAQVTIVALRIALASAASIDMQGRGHKTPPELANDITFAMSHMHELLYAPGHECAEQIADFHDRALKRAGEVWPAAREAVVERRYTPLHPEEG